MSVFVLKSQDPQVDEMNASRLNKFIGLIIRKRRRDLNFSAVELSAISGVPMAKIVGIEWHMLDDIDILALDSLCNALDISLPVLLESTLCRHLQSIQGSVKQSNQEIL